MTHTIICRAKWICLISVLLTLPAIASAQEGDDMIIIFGLLHELNKVVDLSLGFSMAHGMNPPVARK